MNGNIMEKEKVLSKIRKLKAMAATVGPEAENAKRLIERLINKYEVNPDELDSCRERTRYRVRTHRLKKYAIHLSGFIGFPIYTIKGMPDFVYIKVDSDEYLMFYELYDEMKHIFHKKESELKKEYGASRIKNDLLKSFMSGYVHSNYPVTAGCPNCGEKDSIKDNRCTKCGMAFKNSSWQGYRHNTELYNEGLATNTKCLKVKRNLIEQH